MPAYVDHEKRRRILAEIAGDLIASGGVEAATVRAVAAAAGYSTKVVSHYFADKRALMLHTYRHAVARSRQIVDASQASAQARGHTNIVAFAHALLPTDDAIRRNWLVWFAFWGLAIADPELAHEQRRRVRDANAHIAAILASDPRFKALLDVERQHLATRIYSSILGVALQAVFDPAGWPQDRQHAILDEVLLTAGGVGGAQDLSVS